MIAAAVAVGFRVGTSSYDDAYITYAFAKSVAAGEGLAWHGTPVLGTSSPFLALLLGGLERLAPIGIPVWGAILSTTAAAAAGGALLALGRREGWGWSGPVAAIFWILWPGRYGHNGGEMALAIAAVIVAAAAFAANRPRTAGLALAVAVMFRAEAGLAAPILVAGLAGRDGLRRALPAAGRAAAVSMAVVAGWAIALGAIAGSVLPRTLEAKRAQAQSVLSLWNSAGGRLLTDELAWIAAAAMTSLAVLFVLALLGIVVLLLRRPPLGTALVAWGIAHLLLVALLGIPRYTWYVEPFRLSLLLAAAFGAGAGELVPRRVGRWIRPVVALLVLVLLGIGLQSLRSVVDSGGDARQARYEEVARAADEYPSGTTIAGFEVGYLGFATRQPVLDLLGLVTPEVPLDLLRRGDLAGIRRRLDPDLLIVPLDGGLLTTGVIGDPGEFVARYRLDRQLIEGGRPVAIYRRISLPGRGPVVRDMIPDFADVSPPATVLLGNETGLAVRLRAGERHAVRVPAIGARRLVFAAGGEGLAARLVVRRGEPGAEAILDDVPVSPGASWNLRSLPFPGEEPARVEFACEGDTGGTCLVGMPHLAAR